ncbi:MAG: aminoacyl-tRNA hydrolase [Gammaproteobacteria bacterium]
MSAEGKIQLIVGLGNPGPEYRDTRHNAGFWFLDELARRYSFEFRPESRFFGETARARIEGQDTRLLKPTTYMNHSGRAVSAMAGFFRIPVEAILVVHDEIDLPPGVARLKRGGGHGGHNGLRDVIAALGSREFSRLRLGVGHPGQRDEVVDYVLRKPTREERNQIEASIDQAFDVLPDLLANRWQRAMTTLHSTSTGK